MQNQVADVGAISLLNFDVVPLIHDSVLSEEPASAVAAGARRHRWNPRPPRALTLGEFWRQEGFVPEHDVT